MTHIMLKEQETSIYIFDSYTNGSTKEIRFENFNNIRFPFEMVF